MGGYHHQKLSRYGNKIEDFELQKIMIFFPDEILTIHSYYFHSKSG